MKRASVTEAKNGLSALIAGLRNGSGVLITDRGRPVARLEPIDAGELEDDDRLRRLASEGVIRLPRRALPRAIFRELPPEAPGADLLGALLEERREGR